MQKKDYVLLLAIFLIVLLLGVVVVQFYAMQKAEKCNNVTPTTGESVSLDETKEDKNDYISKDDNIVVQLNEKTEFLGDVDGKKFEILKNGLKVAEINRKNNSEAQILKQIDENTYIGVSNTGRGGYILFGSYFGLYKFNTITNEINKILDDDEDSMGFSSFQVYDISPDQKYMVGVGSDNGNRIEIRNIQDNSLVNYFTCPDNKYRAWGDVYFFDAGSKLVYEAAVVNPDDEEFAMFTVDIESGQQEMVANEAGGKIDAADWALRRQ